MTYSVKVDKHFIMKRLYDLIISISFTWSVYELCVYMAKTYETHGTWFYIPLILVLFLVLSRSIVGIALMNLIVFSSFPSIFHNSIIHRTGDLLFVAPGVMMFLQILIALVQAGLFILLIRHLAKAITKKWVIIAFAGLAVLFTVIFTLYVYSIPTGPLPYS